MIKILEQGTLQETEVSLWRSVLDIDWVVADSRSRLESVKERRMRLSVHARPIERTCMISFMGIQSSYVASGHARDTK